MCVSAIFNCHLNYNPITHLWNPLVRKYKTLPDSPLSAYWLGIDGRTHGVVVCFDTKTDVLQAISLPDSVGSHPSILHPFGQSIAYFVEDHKLNAYELWELKDNRINKSSWEKKIRVSLRENVRVTILGTRNNGEPILAELYNLISYNLDNHEPDTFVDSWNLWADFPSYDSDDNDYEHDTGLDHLSLYVLSWRVWFCLILDGEN